jgi:serine/threonine protein kinase
VTVDHLDDNAASEFVSGTLAKTAVTRVETHLASCRDCRQLVAALAGGEEDSQALTHKHERLSPSQVAQRPTRTYTVGDRVGRYLVLSVLGSGGMGVVFAAYDPQLDRKVALKLLRAGLGVNTKEARARLRREAQAIAQLSHPNVVGVYDVGATDDGDLYIAMEFVEGDTLTTWLKRWPRTWREIVDVYLQAARGLYAAHSVGLLHRDFKPDNVLVGGDGRVRVTDFGLARSLLGPDEAVRPTTEATALNFDLTVTGTVLGTPRYMPPEQLTGPDIDARSDQFSYCVALFESLYGTHPLHGATSVAMLETGARAALPPEGTKVPPAIGRAVMRGLERERGKRFASMAALITELTPVPQRSPLRFAALGLGAVVLLGGASAAVIMRPPTPPPTLPIEDNATQELLDRLNTSEQQRRHLMDELKQRKNDQTVIEDLKEKLKEKDHEIHDLVDQVTKIGNTAKAKVTSTQLPSQSALIRDAVTSGAQDNLEGCFLEWSERNPRTDADLMVNLQVSAAGVGISQMLSGTELRDGKPLPLESESLKFCVQAAIAGVKFPSGPQVLDLEVAVGWSAGMLFVSPRVTGRHEVSRGLLDL